MLDGLLRLRDCWLGGRLLLGLRRLLSLSWLRLVVWREGRGGVGLGGGGHLDILEGGGATVLLLFDDHLVNYGGGVAVEHVVSVEVFGEEVVAHRAAGVATDRVTFSVDDVSEEAEAGRGFFPADVAGARKFNLFRSGNYDRRFTLTRVPDASFRFYVIRNHSGKVGFHRLVLL